MEMQESPADNITTSFDGSLPHIVRIHIFLICHWGMLSPFLFFVLSFHAKFGTFLSLPILSPPILAPVLKFALRKGHLIFWIYLVQIR